DTQSLFFMRPLQSWGCRERRARKRINKSLRSHISAVKKCCQKNKNLRTSNTKTRRHEETLSRVMLPYASMALVLRSSSATRILAGVLAAAALAIPRPVVTGSRPETAAAFAAGRTEPALFECRWTDLPVRIDGKGDDAAWKAARVIERFALPWAGKGARAATRARLLWDRENLYFLAEMSDVDLYAEVRDDAP